MDRLKVNILVNSWLLIQEANSELTEQRWEFPGFPQSPRVNKMKSLHRENPGRAAFHGLAPLLTKEKIGVGEI